MRVPLLFRTEQARAALRFYSEPTLPAVARARYVVNQLVGTRLCRASIGRQLRRAYASSGIPSWNLRVPIQPTMDDTTLASLFFGTYESAELLLLKRHFLGSPTVIELGSSLGVVAAHMASALPSSTMLICVEPNALLAPSIQALVAQANPDITLCIEQAAVAQAGTSTVSMDFTDLNAAHAVQRPESSRGSSVPAITLSQLIARHLVGEYSLVCDIEGAEASLLLDDPGALSGCHELLLELHSTTHNGLDLTPADLDARVRELGFLEVESVKRSACLMVSYYRASNR